MSSRAPTTGDSASAVEDAGGELVAATMAPSSRVDPADDRPPVGSWWWVRGSGHDDHEFDRPGKIYLACVIETGSNYAKVAGVTFSNRIALDDFAEICTAEPNPDCFIDEKVEAHRAAVRALMGKVRALCHRLGVPMRQALATAGDASSRALAVAHGTSDAKAYGKSLVLAKDKTLPDLFKKIREQHEAMAKWMKAELIPATAELAAATEVTKIIAGKIHTVELYAGLAEELAQIREGAPASVDERVRLMQRMHFMDEECLVRYEAGGMDFEDLGAFDRWLSRDENFARIFPHRRCVVAFRVRRGDKDYGDLSPWISFKFNEANKATFLYIRNGDQLWYMRTSIEFGKELFPSREDSDLLGDDELWVKENEWDIERGTGIITGRKRAEMIEDHRQRRWRAAEKLRQWRRAGKPEGTWTYVVSDDDESGDGGWYGKKAGDEVRIAGKPHGAWHHDDLDRPPHLRYERLTPENIFYDDAMRRVQNAALEHNRVAVIVQGLLDRSTCLHPHPPWRIWTPEGFASGIELVYDVSRALVAGEAPDFEEYRRQLNRGIRPGCHTIGQRDAWASHMVKRHGDKYWQYGRHGKGPDHVHRVERVRRDGACEFRLTRDRVTPKWVPDPENPGYRRAIYPEIGSSWICPASELTCVDAYTPGDFHLFFDDPRTRADYLRWAPILLACEDWHAARRAAAARDDDDDDAKAKARKRKRRRSR